ncbi:MAG: ankyrin repeat domain-containing protein [Gemmatimonadota bacterium]|nr:MAG: ankyrin repeat domain-containing protein [Gemmatimonadota bacterium]
MRHEAHAIRLYAVPIALLVFSATPLSLEAQSVFDAAREGDASAVRELLASEPSLVAQTDQQGRTLLHLAARFGHAEVCAALADAGADVHAEDEDGETPLHSATRRNQLAVAQCLLKHGAETERRNEYGRTPLLLAARETGNVEMGRLLIAAGADVNATDRQGATPLILAAWMGYRGLVNLLVDEGVRLPPAGSWEAQSLVMLSADKGHDRLFVLLADSGADLTMRNDNGGSLLHSASQGGSALIGARLLEMGFDVNERDRYGRVPLHYAAELGREDVAQTLLDRGANIDARSLSGESAYNTAAAVGREAMARFLAAAGASTEPRRFPVLEGPYMGQTPPAAGADPTSFALDIVSTHRFQHGTVAFSPDGTEAYWSTEFALADSGYSGGMIVFSRAVNSRWSEPAQAPFSQLGLGDDVPIFAPDGERLYFLSTRPTAEEDGRQAERIWYVTRGPHGWSEPQIIEGGPNTLDLHWEFSVAADGSIYSPGDGDIWVSRLVDGVHQTPENLGAPVNSDANEGAPFIAPDQSYLIFMRARHGENLGYVDLWISFRDESGSWTVPVNLGQPVTSRGNEICPIVSHDGKYLFFNSSRLGNDDNYWVDASFIEDLRREALR